MIELLEKLVRFIPDYFDTLLSLVVGPKSFIAEKLSRDELVMQKALVFLAISFLMGWLLGIPFSQGDPLLELGAEGVFVLIRVMAFGGVLYLAWRVVGGRADIKKLLTIYFYYSGVVKLLMTSTFLSFMGAMRTTDPVLYEEFYDALSGANIMTFVIINNERLLESFGYRLSLLVAYLGYGAIFMWLFIGWGAYRELSRLSKVRSVLAGLLFLVFCFPVAVLIFFIASALVKQMVQAQIYLHHKLLSWSTLSTRKMAGLFFSLLNMKTPY